MKSLVICLMGPTAAGKTDLAVNLVQQLPCEIISVDSAMVYRGMDIGTAKPTQDILQIAPHRLLDIRDPKKEYSAGEFRDDAIKEINNIISRKKIPLLVGGTMLYFHALQQGIAQLPRANKIIRQKLLSEAAQVGWEQLHQRLQVIDPVSATRIHVNDSQRIQRALEVYLISGKTLTEHCQTNDEFTLPYDFINFAIMPTERSQLHDAIAKRFHLMLQQGFIDEVTTLYNRGDLHPDLPAIRAVGYRQLWDYLEGKLSYADMIERGIIATRQLAKRQITWLRSWKNLICLDSGCKNNINKIINFLDEFKSGV